MIFQDLIDEENKLLLEAEKNMAKSILTASI